MKEGKRECQAVEQLFSALDRVIGLLNASRDEPTSNRDPLAEFDFGTDDR